MLFPLRSIGRGTDADLNMEVAPVGSAYDKAKQYGIQLGGTGRLLSKLEVNSLHTKGLEGIEYGNSYDAVMGYVAYWVGNSYSAYADGSCVMGRTRKLYGYNYQGYTNATNFGVRPVITVQKDKVR